ncbi:MAG: sugar phosphate isomerase/epimerase [Anaerolineae bacterium]|nr:MAG: sugar phosphate isomerase/epimerase [Anaerolineae bacterium]
MLLAINGATTMKATLPKDIAVASAAGFKALEIWAAKMDAYLQDRPVDALKALFDEADLQPASINSIEFITFRPPEEYKAIKARCRELCELAQILDCDKIVVVPSPTPKGATWDAIRAESVRVLQELSDIAHPHGVRLAFEFLGFPWCSVRTLAQCWEIVKETQRANVGLVIDTCHFYAGGSELSSIRQVEPQKVFIFHINDVEDRPPETIEDAHRLLPGEGVVPLDDILIRLKHIGFNGLCSIELFRPEYWERDPAELAAAARTATLDLLETYFSVV